MTGRFVSALGGHAVAVPPVWCMRQAGRYQRSYQSLRQRHSFEELCREPAALAQTRDALDRSKGLIGFMGGSSRTFGVSQTRHPIGWGTSPACCTRPISPQLGVSKLLAFAETAAARLATVATTPPARV